MAYASLTKRKTINTMNTMAYASFIIKDNLYNLNNWLTRIRWYQRSWASRYDAKPLSFLVPVSMRIKFLLLMLFKVVIVV